MTRDPDLDAAIEELEFTANRIRLVEEQIVRADEVKEYQLLARRKHDLADLKGEIAVRADKLKMDPRALLLVVEQANRLRRQFRRRPTATQLENVLRTISEITARDQVEASAALALARDQHAHVLTRGRAVIEVLNYMEASR